MEEIKENIKVFIRQRPPNRDDALENSTMIGKSIVRKDGGTVAISGIQSIAPNGQNCTYFSGISHANHKFVMDHIFSGDATQCDVYDTVAKPIVDSCLKGYSGLVLAYGPTGSGKTYTMRGPQGGEVRGVMSRCIEQILAANSHGTMEIWASYLQIYCEQISDLLRDNLQDLQATEMSNNVSAAQHFNGDSNLNLRMKPDGSGVYVEGLMRYRIASVDDLFDVLERGDQYRSVAATKVNEFSSRSHAVLMLSIMIPEETVDSQTGAVSVDERVMREGQLMLVDLAGSERAHASEGKSYLRLEEAKAINLSLSALGNVMNALAENKQHVPYRDSKLTRLLQNCLGGTARTAIIVNVVPGEDATGETLNTLRFANRASKVKVVAKISKHRNFEMLLKEALQQIKELEHFKQQSLQLSGVQEDMQEKEALIEQLRLEIQMHKVQITQLQRENEFLKKSGAGLNDSNGARLLSRVPSNPSLVGNLFPPMAPADSTTSSSMGSSFPSTMSASTLALLNMKSSGIAAASDADSVATEEIVTLSAAASGTQSVQQSKAEDLMAVEAMSRSLKQKATDMKYKRLTQQVLDAERELKEERERHLRTVQELRALHDQNLSHESYFNKRIDELLQELTERQNLLDEHQQVLQGEREEKAALEEEMTTMKSKMTTMIDKEQVGMMETLFQETIERMNQRVQYLELQSFQQQQQFYEDQQLHLQEKHQWLEQHQQQHQHQQQKQAPSKNPSQATGIVAATASYGGKGGYGICARSSANAKTNPTTSTSVNKAPNHNKNVLSTYSFWTPEGANALRQQQLQQQNDRVKESSSPLNLSPRPPGVVSTRLPPNAPSNVPGLQYVNSGNTGQSTDSLTSSGGSGSQTPQDVGQFSNKQHVRLEPGGRLRPHSSNSNHPAATPQSDVSPPPKTYSGGGLTTGNNNNSGSNNNSNNNLRASLSAPKTLRDSMPLSPSGTTGSAPTGSAPTGSTGSSTAMGSSPRSGSVTRRSLVVVDPVTGITTTTTTTTTTMTVPDANTNTNTNSTATTTAAATAASVASNGSISGRGVLPTTRSFRMVSGTTSNLSSSGTSAASAVGMVLRLHPSASSNVPATPTPDETFESY